MRRLRPALFTLALAGLLACGGRALEEPDGGDSDPSAPGTTDPSEGSAGKASNNGSLPSQPLGKCKPGFERARNPTRACHWLTETGLCFEDSNAACACICPTDRDSVCWHGFDGGPDSATLVDCD